MGVADLRGGKGGNSAAKLRRKERPPLLTQFIPIGDDHTISTTRDQATLPAGTPLQDADEVPHRAGVALGSRILHVLRLLLDPVTKIPSNTDLDAGTHAKLEPIVPGHHFIQMPVAVDRRQPRV